MVRVLPGCRHAFHVPCIDQWLKGHVNCPLCRSPVCAPGANTVIELPAELNRGGDVADEDTNSMSTTCETRVSMIRHCASMILGREMTERGSLEENLKRSMSMDHFFLVTDVRRSSLGLV